MTSAEKQPVAAETQRRAPLLKWLLRGALGAGILLYLLSQCRGGQLGTALRALDLRLWLATVLVYLGGQALCAYKWGILARAMGMRRSYRELLAYYFGGMFANLFLPTTVGGDLGRALAVSRPDGSLGNAVISVLADRGTGFTALLLIASFGVLLLLPVLPPWLSGATLAATLALLLAGAAALAFPDRFRRLGSKLHGAITACRRPETLVPAALLSLIFQTIIVLAHILMGRALGLSLPVGYFLLAATLVSVVTMLPISVNGLGTRDAAFVYFLGLAGAPHATGLAFALSWLALVVFCSGIGGVLCVVLAPGQLAVFTRKQEGC